MKNPYYNPAKKHHRPNGFQNNYQSFRGKRWHEILQWRWQAWRAGHPRPLQTPIPVVEPDLGFIHANAQAGLAMQPVATWIGHITVLLQIGGLNLLTDPVFSERCFPVQWTGPQRQTPPGLRLNQLPHIDVVLLSHNHYDHMDEASLLAFYRRMLAFRRSRPAFAKGDFRLVDASERHLAFTRSHKGETLLAAFNLSDGPLRLTLPEGAWTVTPDSPFAAEIDGSEVALAPFQALFADRRS